MNHYVNGPDPREGLDEGSIEELAHDLDGVDMGTHPHQHWEFDHRDLQVPEHSPDLDVDEGHYGDHHT